MVLVEFGLIPMPWINEVEVTSFEVLAVKRNSKATGWILEGLEVSAFVYNSNPELKHLLIALASWVDTGSGKAIQVVKDSKLKCGFSIKPLLNKNKPVEQKWNLTGVGYAIQIDGVEPESNPFL